MDQMIQFHNYFYKHNAIRGHLTFIHTNGNINFVANSERFLNILTITVTIKIVEVLFDKCVTFLESVVVKNYPQKWAAKLFIINANLTLRT